jgi:hypothetical protein
MNLLKMLTGSNVIHVRLLEARMSKHLAFFSSVAVKVLVDVAVSLKPVVVYVWTVIETFDADFTSKWTLYGHYATASRLSVEDFLPLVMPPSIILGGT